MKKLFVFAFFFLFVSFFFAGCKGGAVSTDVGETAVREVGAGDIAYIRVDSLINNYQRYLDLSEKFEAKATKAQRELETRARRLQNEMMDLEDKASKGLMTRSQIASTQEQLQTKAQAFEGERQSRLSELAEEEQVMTNQVMHAIDEFIKEFNKDLRFKMILTTSGGTPILHADPALDVTAEVLAGLNAQYAAEPKTAE